MCDSPAGYETHDAVYNEYRAAVRVDRMLLVAVAFNTHRVVKFSQVVQ